MAWRRSAGVAVGWSPPPPLLALALGGGAGDAGGWLATVIVRPVSTVLTLSAASATTNRSG